MGSTGAMGSPPDPAEMFNSIDEGGSLDTSEAQSLTEMIREATGEDMDTETLLAAYDEDEDGVLSEEETLTAVEANRPEGPPPQGDMASQTQGPGSANTSAISNYLQMASLGADQNQGSNMFAMFGNNNSSNAYSRLFSVDTRI